MGQGLEAGLEGLGVAIGQPAGLEARQCLAHFSQGDLHQQQAGVAGGPLQGALITALPQAQQQFQGQAEPLLAWIAKACSGPALGASGNWQAALAVELH